MPSITTELVEDLVRALGIRRAVETGTYKGDGAKRLAAVVPEVVTIEPEPALYAAAARNLSRHENIRVLEGRSLDYLAALAADGTPTLYFLDSHWSGGVTAGEENECPVLDEIDAIRRGTGNDVVVVDDARYFASPPPPPHDPDQWPTLIEVMDALRERPDSYITMLEDRVIAVPSGGRQALDAYGQRLSRGTSPGPGSHKASVRARLFARWRSALSPN